VYETIDNPIAVIEESRSAVKLGHNPVNGAFPNFSISVCADKQAEDAGLVVSRRELTVRILFVVKTRGVCPTAMALRQLWETVAIAALTSLYNKLGNFIFFTCTIFDSASIIFCV
jgi:hypothetical protein